MSRLQPRAKAVSTANVSSQSASTNPSIGAAPTTTNLQDGLPKAGGLKVRSGAQPPYNDPASDRSTLFLIRRTLCPNLAEKGRNTPAPIDGMLPPLTSSNEVDLQLYAFIAIIIREFVHTWYTKITPDSVFVEEVVQIIAHCTRALEQRLRNVDLESLVFDELPDLLDVHVQAYRASHQPFNPPPIETNPREIYHSLWPMPALSPVPDGSGGPLTQQQMNNEAVYRQMLVQGVLAVLLPTEDLENDCLTTLVGQIFSEMIIGNGIGGKAAEPWLLWEGITKIAEVVQEQLPRTQANVRLARSNSESLGPSITPEDLVSPKRKWNNQWNIQKTFWLILQYAYVAFTAARFLISTLATSSSLPSRVISTKINSLALLNNHLSESGSDSDPIVTNRILPSKTPIIEMRIWSAAARLLDFDFRMPWLASTLSILQWAALTGPGKLGNTDGRIDKILSHAIHTHVLDPSRLPFLLRTMRTTIFPANTLAPPREIPTHAQSLLLRRKCAETILSLIPAQVQDIYFGPGLEKRTKEVEDVLDCFGDNYCNKHLLYGIVELIIIRLMPELGEKGIEALLEERLS